MTPAEFKAARKRLGLSQEEMAKFLRLSDARAVRSYEAGDRAISGPIQVAIEMREILAELVRLDEEPFGMIFHAEEGSWPSDELEEVVTRARTILGLPES